LSRYLLERTIRLSQPLSQVVVVSRSASVRCLAKQAGAWALVEAGAELNMALKQASDWVVSQGGEQLLILPGDLPLLSSEVLANLWQLGQNKASLVIAPCHRHDGTNALLLHPPGQIDFSFGPGSFARHQQLARAKRIEPIIVHSPALALDLDLPADLAQLSRLTGRTRGYV
jgi:2-phospho-L-lactate guanylyltransferase